MSIKGLTERFVLMAGLAGVAIALALKFVLISRIAINWDEFWFLDQVQQYLRGELTGRFQTLHVHVFAWLPATGVPEVDQIVAGRAMMQLLAVGSAGFIYAIARRFITREAAVFATLAYLSVNVVIEHSASFRLDPMVTFLSLLALYATLAWRLRGAILAGMVMAVAMMLTIKSVFYIAIIGGVFALSVRINDALAFGLALLIAFAALYTWHDATLAAPPVADAAAFLAGTAGKVFADALATSGPVFIAVVMFNPVFWILLIVGAVVAARTVRREGWLPLVLALPVLAPLVYRNAFVYFYPFMLASAAVLVGLAFDRFRVSRGAQALLILAVLGSWTFGMKARLPDETGVQRETLAAVHAAFPDPVPVIEGFGVLGGEPRSGFRRVGFFMSSWGVENYLAAGKPVYADLIATHQPPLLLADSPSLYAAMLGVETTRPLLAEDVRVLRENYVRRAGRSGRAGMLFVAGKSLEKRCGSEFEIAIAGAYRLEVEGPVAIDGRTVGRGDQVELGIGRHAIAFGGNEQVLLTWAKVGDAPEHSATPLDFFGEVNWGGMTADKLRSGEAIRRLPECP